MSPLLQPLLALLPALLAPPGAVDRRDCLTSLVRSTVASTLATVASTLAPAAWGSAASTAEAAAVGGGASGRLGGGEPRTVTLPLEPCGGGAICVRLTATGLSSADRVSGRVRSVLPSAPSLPFRVYRAAVDTGSPYLVLSGGDLGRDVVSSGSLPILLDSNRPLWWGESFLALVEESLGFFGGSEALFFFADSAYPPTEEIYGSRAGQILWKSAPVRFRDPRLVSMAEGMSGGNGGSEREMGFLVLGVMDEVLTRESGGSLLGLVKQSNPGTQKSNLRPTFLEQQRLVTRDDERDDMGGQTESPTLEQLEIAAFTVDYPKQELTLSSGALIPRGTENALPLVDLRPLGDFVEHYACTVEEVTFDNSCVDAQTLAGKVRTKGKPRQIVAVFDTGLTGCLLTQPFWDELVRQGLTPDQFLSVRVGIKEEGECKQLGSKGEENRRDVFTIGSSTMTNRYFYVAPISLDWFDDEATAPFVIVLGQTFLSQGALTIDIDDRRALFVPEKDKTDSR